MWISPKAFNVNPFLKYSPMILFVRSINKIKSAADENIDVDCKCERKHSKLIVGVN